MTRLGSLPDSGGISVHFQSAGACQEVGHEFKLRGSIALPGGGTRDHSQLLFAFGFLCKEYTIPNWHILSLSRARIDKFPTFLGATAFAQLRIAKKAVWPELHFAGWQCGGAAQTQDRPMLVHGVESLLKS